MCPVKCDQIHCQLSGTQHNGLFLSNSHFLHLIQYDIKGGRCQFFHVPVQDKMDNAFIEEYLRVVSTPKIANTHRASATE